jgi:hypothetical protein
MEAIVWEVDVNWAGFEKQQPELAELGRKKLGEPGLVMIGTLRRDGTARLSPVNPYFWDGDLCVSLAAASRKAGDLTRDTRLLIHSLPGHKDGSDGEYKVRGQAVLETDTGTQARFVTMVGELTGWAPPAGMFRLYRVDLEDITFIDRQKSANPFQPEITRWTGPA